MAKILLVISHLRAYGGAETVGVWLAHALTRAGHEVGIAEVYDGKGSPITYDIEPGITLHHINADESHRLRYNISCVSNAVKSLITTRGYTTCIYEGDYQSFLCLKATITTKNCTFIHHDHGAIESQWGVNKTTLMRTLGSFACDKLAVLTQKSKDFYQEHLHLSPEKVAVMVNPLTKPVDSTCQDLMLCSSDPGKGKILWAGRFSSEKGTGRIISSTEQALREQSNWSAHIYGSGNLNDDLQAEIARSSCSGLYVLEGYAPDMTSVYAQHHIGIMTSDREGLPLFLIEAQSAGLPCIAYDVVTGPSEVIQDGVTGFLIEPFNTVEFNKKLALLMSDHELRTTMGKAAQKAAQRFEEQTVIRAWEGVID